MTVVQEAVQCEKISFGDGFFKVEYVPTRTGVHTVNISFQNTNIPDSPFEVYVANEIEQQVCKITIWVGLVILGLDFY
jgi:hypothetical protein